MSKAKVDMIRVDRAEYEAFRDAAESAERRVRAADDRAEGHRLEAIKAQEHYAGCLEVNKEQATRLARHGLVITNFNEHVDACEREIARLKKELEQYKPPKLEVGPQPAIGARRTA